MSDWVGLAVIVGIVAVAIFALSRAGRPGAPISEAEFERRARESPSLMSAGFIGLQKILDPAAEKAIEAQEDLRQGRYSGEQESGDGGDKARKEERTSDRGD